MQDIWRKPMKYMLECKCSKCVGCAWRSDEDNDCKYCKDGDLFLPVSELMDSVASAACMKVCATCDSWINGRCGHTARDRDAQEACDNWSNSKYKEVEF